MDVRIIHYACSPRYSQQMLIAIYILAMRCAARLVSCSYVIFCICSIVGCHSPGPISGWIRSAISCCCFLLSHDSASVASWQSSALSLSNVLAISLTSSLLPGIGLSDRRPEWHRIASGRPWPARGSMRGYPSFE